MIDQKEDLYFLEWCNRCHNGMWHTVNSYEICQFTNHIRAICGLGFVENKKISNATMTNILGDEIKEYRNLLPTYIDLTFLGMGSDGHVASIFKKSKNKNKVIITSSKKHPFQRCTVSLNYLNKSKKIFTLIKGKKKYKFFLNHLMNNKYKLLPVSQINNNTLILNGINCKDFVKIKKFINGKPLKIKISFDKVSYNFLKK